MATQQERSALTLKKLVDAALDLFSRQGYAGTSIDEIAAQAGLTKGAFYHQFADKKAVFIRALEEAEQWMIDSLAPAAAIKDPCLRLRQGAGLFLEACLDPVYQQIMLRDGPSVLGSQQWRAICSSYTLGIVTANIKAIMKAGLIAPRPVEPLAQLLLALLAEGGRFIADAPDPRAAQAAIQREVDGFLDGLLGTARPQDQ